MQNYRDKDLEIKLPKKYKIVSDKEFEKIWAQIKKRYHKLF